MSREQATGQGERRLEEFALALAEARWDGMRKGALNSLAIHKYFCLCFASDMETATTTTVSSEAPQLAPPGAGLPWLELQIARLLFRRFQRRHSRTQLDAYVERERSIMLNHR
jgi:hypothetical protein